MNMHISGILIILSIVFTSCTIKSRPIVEGQDVCEFCKMTVMEKQFAGELVTTKGRYYIFDDITCMINFIEENTLVAQEVETIYVTDFFHEDQLIEASTATYYTSEALRTPMNGKTVALGSDDDLIKMKNKLSGAEKTWDAMLK